MLLYLYSSKDLDYLDSRIVSALSVLQTQVQGLWRRKQPQERANVNASNKAKGLFREEVVFMCGSVDGELSSGKHR